MVSASAGNADARLETCGWKVTKPRTLSTALAMGWSTHGKPGDGLSGSASSWMTAGGNPKGAKGGG